MCDKGTSMRAIEFEDFKYTMMEGFFFKKTLKLLYWKRHCPAEITKLYWPYSMLHCNLKTRYFSRDSVPLRSNLKETVCPSGGRGYLAITKFIRQNFGRSVTLYLGPLEADFSKIWQTYCKIMGVHQYYFFSMNRALRKLKFEKKRDFVSKVAPRETHKASWFHHSRIRQNPYCVMYEADFF